MRNRGRYMNLNYAIFRSEPIMTINDLAQIGSHNKREKKAYNSNPDIDFFVLTLIIFAFGAKSSFLQVERSEKLTPKAMIKSELFIAVLAG